MVGKLKFKKNVKSVHALHLNLNRSCKKITNGGGGRGEVVCGENW